MHFPMKGVDDRSADNPLTRKGVLLGRIEMLRETARAFEALVLNLPGPSSLGANPSPLEIAQAQQALICGFSDWMRVELDEQLGELSLHAQIYREECRPPMPGRL